MCIAAACPIFPRVDLGGLGGSFFFIRLTRPLLSHADRNNLAVENAVSGVSSFLAAQLCVQRVAYTAWSKIVNAAVAKVGLSSSSA